MQCKNNFLNYFFRLGTEVMKVVSPQSSANQLAAKTDY
jgi:hypothetical protein